MSRKHMLPYPLCDFEIKTQDLEAMVAHARAKGGSVTLEEVCAHALHHAMLRMAKRARRPKRSDFVIGLGLWAAMQMRHAIDRIENEGLLPLCDFPDETDAIYEEIAAFGRREMEEHFDAAHGVFKL